MSLGLLAFSGGRAAAGEAVRVWGGGGAATMCTHFIHQCVAAQNDGNAKTNDDVCLGRGRERAGERVASLPGGRNRLS